MELPIVELLEHDKDDILRVLQKLDPEVSDKISFNFFRVQAQVKNFSNYLTHISFSFSRNICSNS